MPSNDVEKFFDNTISQDFFSTFAGDVIGSGLARIVHEVPLRPDLVVKIETDSGSFQNVLEWETWQYNREHKAVARWLAPCVAISPCGTVLVMERTTPVPPGNFPKTLPAFLTDTKRTNFGMLKGKLVCHDYALTLADYPLRQRRADWWD